MRNRSMSILGVAMLTAATSSCTSISSNYTGSMTVPEASRIYVCSGYDCYYKSKLELTSADGKRFAQIMAKGSGSAAAERAAISNAVQYFEERSYSVTGVRDEPQSTFGAARNKGQMDCIDESTNTRSMLKYLQARGLLKHHTVEANVSRGLFVDGRYPHSTAVVRENGGVKWAVDSWYAPMGGAPDIIPLKDWLPRGFLRSGALNT